MTNQNQICNTKYEISIKWTHIYLYYVWLHIVFTSYLKILIPKMVMASTHSVYHPPPIICLSACVAQIFAGSWPHVCIPYVCIPHNCMYTLCNVPFEWDTRCPFCTDQAEWPNTRDIWHYGILSPCFHIKHCIYWDIAWFIKISYVFYLVSNHF